MSETALLPVAPPLVAPSAAPTERAEARASARGAGVAPAAQAFEAAFLSEMLRHAGLARPPETFGGGVGEDRFSGLLVRAYGERLAEAGVTGIAEAVAAQMSLSDDGGRTP